VHEDLKDNIYQWQSAVGRGTRAERREKRGESREQREESRKSKGNILAKAARQQQEWRKHKAGEHDGRRQISGWRLQRSLGSRGRGAERQTFF
jgi:hypothetical protein